MDFEPLRCYSSWDDLVLQVYEIHQPGHWLPLRRGFVVGARELRITVKKIRELKIKTFICDLPLIVADTYHLLGGIIVGCCLLSNLKTNASHL